MDIVNRLKSSHSMLGDPLHREAWEEIEQLRTDKAEVLWALKHMVRWYDQLSPKDIAKAQAAIDKAIGGNDG